MNPEKRSFDPRDPQYKKYDDLPSEGQPFFVPSADGQGFVSKSAREYEGSMEAKALQKNIRRRFLEKIFGEKTTSMDMAMIEAQLTNAITDISIEQDRAMCTLDIDEHHIILEGTVHAQKVSSGDRRTKTVYVFVVDAGTIDGETIDEEQFADYSNYVGPSIINGLHMMAMKKKIADTNDEHRKDV
jgi:hypothetical protein